MAERSLLASNLAVASGTLASRLTGLARVIIFAAVIGQTALADAFDVGNNAPNVIFELLIGGTLTAALIPLFTAQRQRHDRAGTAAVFGAGLLLLALITVLAVIIAPLVFRVYALNPAGDADAFYRVGTALTRVFLVQVFFYGLNALVSAMLNAAGRFAVAAWAPVAANLVAIVALAGIYALDTERPIPLDAAAGGSTLFWWFSLGPTLGIAAMSLVVLIAAMRAGVVPAPVVRLSHPAVREIARLSVWAIAYIATNQVALIVVKNLAEPGSGRLDAYAKAMILFQLPHGLLAVTIATTFAPMLARAVADGNSDEFRTRFLTGARSTALLTVAPSVLLVVLAQPIVRLLLGWGAFDDAAVKATSEALSGLAVGLVGFSLYLFALRGFYSHGDTRTPFVINVGQNALNIALALVLVQEYGVRGLGLAFGVSYLVFAVVALGWLRRRFGTAGPVQLVLGSR
jgi:putative peptidoglycan lipid II flippase